MKRVLVLSLLLLLSVFASGERSALLEVDVDGSAFMVAEIKGEPCLNGALYSHEMIVEDDSVRVKRELLMTSENTPFLTQAFESDTTKIESVFEVQGERVRGVSQAVASKSEVLDDLLFFYTTNPKPSRVFIEMDCVDSNTTTVLLEFPAGSYLNSGIANFTWLSNVRVNSDRERFEKQLLFKEEFASEYFGLLLQQLEGSSLLPGTSFERSSNSVPVEESILRLPDTLQVVKASPAVDEVVGKTYSWNNSRNVFAEVGRDFGDVTDPENVALIAGIFIIVVLLFNVSQIMQKLGFMTVKEEELNEEADSRKSEKD